MEGLAGLDETLLEDKLEYLHFTTPPPLGMRGVPPPRGS